MEETERYRHSDLQRTAESFTMRLPSRGILAEELFWLQLAESLTAYEWPKSKIFPIWSENSKVIVSRTNSRILWKAEYCHDIKTTRILLLSLIFLLMGILPCFFQAISRKHMLFICIRNSLIKMIVSSVHSSWCWATDPLTNCMNEASLREKDEFLVIFLFAFVTKGGKQWYAAYVPGDLKLKHITQTEVEYKNRDKGSIKHTWIKGECQREIDRE